MTIDKYRNYFDIDPEYFPQIDEAVIKSKPDIWKKFYPHESFVKLLKNTIDVITRKQKVSLWVEGAYGTGKSHAVLTLKKLIDSSAQDTEEYFNLYKEQLNDDLYKKFQQIKNSEQKILTVHRYGSANIQNDDKLVINIQESIVKALEDAGYVNGAHDTLKSATIKWLSEDWAKNAMDSLIKSKYNELFSGDDVNALLNKLNTYTGDALQNLMEKIVKVGQENNLTAFKLSVEDLIEWIRAIIEKNNLKAIVFIWDEFSEYFKNNMRNLTGFQQIADLSGSAPFYLLIVTHDVTHIFSEDDKDGRKVKGRFIDPICKIELPENMAFKLMGKAMEKNTEPLTLERWNETVDELTDRTNESRKLVRQQARIEDKELKDIIPIHPYAALLLKYISTAFDSNQRSMFDFIKNDRGEEIRGFQWFIDNYGADDDNPLLTVDMLWEFFYEKGKDYLAHDIRTVLDTYTLAQAKIAPQSTLLLKENVKQQDNAKQRVLKTVLLLQAISINTGNTVPLFIPNERNINNAFEGSDLDNGEASRIAQSMVPDILFKKDLAGGEWQYSALINVGNIALIDEEKEKIKKWNTANFITNAKMSENIRFNGFLDARYNVIHTSANDFDRNYSAIRAKEGEWGNKINLIVTYGKDEKENIEIERKIANALSFKCDNIVFMDTSLCPLGKAMLEEYARTMANAIVNAKQDKRQATQYNMNAEGVLKKWCTAIRERATINIYTIDNLSGKKVIGIQGAMEELMDIDKRRYPLGLEHIQPVIDVMWQGNAFSSGALCGIQQITKGQFRSANSSTKLEEFIGKDIWNVDSYWEKYSYAPISKLKLFVDKTISEAFRVKGRIAISDIVDVLTKEPYGFMPCNLTAFVLGFLLKEYANGVYTWSDDTTKDKLDEEKLKETITNVLKKHQTPNAKYKENYIVALSNEEKEFNKVSARIFNIDEKMCTSIEKTRDRIRLNMKDLSFPIWTLKYMLDDVILSNGKDEVAHIIDSYIDLANNQTGNKTDSDIAMEIGKLCLENNTLVDDMSTIVSKENCIDGMKKYLDIYDGGKLARLAEQLDDMGQYVNKVKEKFNTDAANWVWKKDTADAIIDEVILEYSIVAESNKYLPRATSYNSVLNEWKCACDNIRVSYDYAKNHWGELSCLMKMLYNLKKIGQLPTDVAEKRAFLDQLQINGKAFDKFYRNQMELFKVVCNFMLKNVDEDTITTAYNKISRDAFLMERQQYQTKIDAILKDVVTADGLNRLKKLWKDRTGTVSPRAWSTTYRMSILYMVPENEIKLAKAAFAVLNSKSVQTKKDIDEAQKYLESANFYDSLNNQEARDEAFTNNVIGRYKVILTNIEQVKDVLDNNLNLQPYDYYGTPTVNTEVEAFAKHEYIGGGYVEALAVIDNMGIDEVKQYLQELIKDNASVGVEIIRKHRGM